MQTPYSTGLRERAMYSDAQTHASDTKDLVTTPRVLRKTLAVLILLGLVMVAYLLWARPYQLVWGATTEEIHRRMPGDELSLRPTFLATRAITIEGTPDVIWPWLVQMGYGRAGFYGYDILENLGSARGIRSAHRILPELQQVAVGDFLPLSAAGGLVFQAIAPPRYLVWAGASGAFPGGFTWALYPVDASHTRLVSRIQWSHHCANPLVLALDVFTEFTDHIAVRKILHGVKDRVEGHFEPMAEQNGEFAVYVWAFVDLLAAVGLILLRPLTWRLWLAGLGTGVAWLIVWYAPITMGIGVAVNLLVLWVLRWAEVNPDTRAPSAHHITGRESP